jgi:hypothetical protein
MKKILAIGGAVIKTAREELRSIIEKDKLEILIHNGGSIFHDFQLAIEDCGGRTSYPLDNLLQDYSCNEKASNLVLDWLTGMTLAPKGSVTRLCEDKGVDVLLFTGMACDFWQLFGNIEDWEAIARVAYDDFHVLAERFKEPFHYVCMGSAVIHPEVFTKALAKNSPKVFKADVVDFLEMYRPRTRVSRFGHYYQMTHKEFLLSDFWEKDYGL